MVLEEHAWKSGIDPIKMLEKQNEESKDAQLGFEIRDIKVEDIKDISDKKLREMKQKKINVKECLDEAIKRRDKEFEELKK